MRWSKLWLTQLLELVPRLGARLKKYDEDIADLNRRVDALTNELLSNSDKKSSIHPGTALDATLLHASAQRAEIERLANLHETTALSLAEIRSDIVSLKTRLDKFEKST